MAGAEVYLHAKFHLDPSNCLATIHQRHRQTGQDRQTDRLTDKQIDNILVAQGEPFYKRSPKKPPTYGLIVVIPPKGAIHTIGGYTEISCSHVCAFINGGLRFRNPFNVRIQNIILCVLFSSLKKRAVCAYVNLTSVFICKNNVCRD